MRAGLRVQNPLLVALVAAGILSGCGKDSPTGPGPGGGGPPLYPALSSPQNVLAALEIAYSHRDSTKTKALYDPNYAGTSQDLTDPPVTLPFLFTYSDEVAHVATLARTPTISFVVLDFGPSTAWTRLESNDPSHPEWAVIQIAGSNFDLQVTDGMDTYQASGANEFLEFTFQPTPDSTSATDTLWNIVRWTETRQP
jgi:hypothetical protein